MKLAAIEIVGMLLSLLILAAVFVIPVILMVLCIRALWIYIRTHAKAQEVKKETAAVRSAGPCPRPSRTTAPAAK